MEDKDKIAVQAASAQAHDLLPTASNSFDILARQVDSVQSQPSTDQPAQMNSTMGDPSLSQLPMGQLAHANTIMGDPSSSQLPTGQLAQPNMTMGDPISSRPPVSLGDLAYSFQTPGHQQDSMQLQIPAGQFADPNTTLSDPRSVRPLDSLSRLPPNGVGVPSQEDAFRAEEQQPKQPKLRKARAKRAKCGQHQPDLQPPQAPVLYPAPVPQPASQSLDDLSIRLGSFGIDEEKSPSTRYLDMKLKDHNWVLHNQSREYYQSLVPDMWVHHPDLKIVRRMVMRELRRRDVLERTGLSFAIFKKKRRVEMEPFRAQEQARRLRKRGIRQEKQREIRRQKQCESRKAKREQSKKIDEEKVQAIQEESMIDNGEIWAANHDSMVEKEELQAVNEDSRIDNEEVQTSKAESRSRRDELKLGKIQARQLKRQAKQLKRQARISKRQDMPAAAERGVNQPSKVAKGRMRRESSSARKHAKNRRRFVENELTNGMGELQMI